MAVLAVAALSARSMAEAAVLDGHEVVALDVFGDADTRRASRRWQPIGDPGGLAIDPGRLLRALHALARAGGERPVGWLAGSGFEARPELLAEGAALLPLIGNAAGTVRRVRDPRQFFGTLAAHGIAHPPTAMHAPADPAGWLSKDANACGGWHIRPAGQADGGDAVPASRYFQRAAAGVPMSATFIADGTAAQVVGFNDLLVRRFGEHPFVYCGCVGPVAVSARVAEQVGAAVRVLVTAFGLRGWCSLDFLRDGDDTAVLELNPRWPASLALYAPRGRVDAQLAACGPGRLPPVGALRPARPAGHRIVFARRELRLGEASLRRIAAWPGAHDVPAAPARLAAGDPLCSLGTQADGAAQVQASLAAGHDALLDAVEALNTPLETSP